MDTQTVIVSLLGSSVVGGVVSAALSSRWEREKQIRDRMITASADFAASAAALTTQLGRLRASPAFTGGVLDGFDRDRQAIGDCEALVADVRSRLFVVEVLFDPRSDTASAAREAVENWEVAWSAMRGYLNAVANPKADQVVLKRERPKFELAYDAATRAMREFGEQASHRFGPWLQINPRDQPFRKRLRQRLKDWL